MDKVAGYYGNPAVAALIEAGIIPRLCKKFELIIEVGQPIRVVAETLVAEEKFRELADVLRDYPEEAAKFAREFVFSEIETGRKLEIK
jgi:hypothetical protein